MSRHQGSLADIVGSMVLLALAGVTVRLLSTGDYLIYVRPGMAPFLAVTAGVLTVLAVWTLHHAYRRGAADRGDGAHGAHLPVVTWLLLWPVLIILIVTPQSLGAFTAARTDPAPLPPSTAGFSGLPAGDPIGLPLNSYVERASYGGEATLSGRRLSILGFVSPGKEPGTWYLTRLLVRCCAADALALRVRAVGAPPQTSDTWLVVTGTYLPNDVGDVPQLRVESVEPAPRPKQPYVYG